MEFEPDNFYHIYNQGNNRQRLFDSNPHDYHLFLTLMRKHLLSHMDLMAYCLMPNHFHLLVRTDARCMETVRIGPIVTNPISRGIQRLLASYTRIVNNRNGRSGSMFRQRTHARCLESHSRNRSEYGSSRDDLVTCFLYIHRNPLDASLVRDLANWAYSSYPDYAGLRNGTLINKEIASNLGIYDPRYFCLQFDNR